MFGKRLGLSGQFSPLLRYVEKLTLEHLIESSICVELALSGAPEILIDPFHIHAL